MKRLFLILCLLASAGLFAQPLAIIPQPSQVTQTEGTFNLNQATALSFDTSKPELKSIAGQLNEYLQKYYGFTLPENGKAKQMVSFKLNKALQGSDEGYLLKVDPKEIVITAKTPAGIFYCVQSLKQMLPLTQNGPLAVPCAEINDQPRFAWRGLHLDVGRHYFPVSFIKKYIDNMAMYKLNTFHWHLTEDQGWRLEINQYPQLTETSSWRDETVVGHASRSKVYDGIGYGGFYTQKQVKEIVQYAAERFITVVPEIEMPGHSVAILAAFPELGCTGGP